MTHPLAAEMAPTGTLRCAINVGNFLLVTGKTDSGDPVGVAPTLAAALAEHLGVPLKLIPYATPGELADASAEDNWDVGFVGAEPARATYVNFTAAYCEIEATYMVPEGSPFQSCDEVDAAGVNIAVSARAAYDLWLERNIKHAEVHRVSGLDASFDLFVEKKMDALAGLRPKLIDDVKKLPGARLLDGQFTAVQQASCTKKSRDAGFKMLVEFIEERKANGYVQSLIEKFGVTGRLSVAPPA
jgi:polar amino acid transport system substrate-binding protein